MYEIYRETANTSHSAPPHTFCGKQCSVSNFEKKGGVVQKKISAQGDIKCSFDRFLPGAYCISCQKRLEKKYDFDDSIPYADLHFFFNQFEELQTMLLIAELTINNAPLIYVYLITIGTCSTLNYLFLADSCYSLLTQNQLQLRI